MKSLFLVIICLQGKYNNFIGFYKLDFQNNNRLDSIYKNVNTLLTEAVIKRLMADREIGCLLSGGLDSSLIAALVSKFYNVFSWSQNIQHIFSK